MIIEAIIVAGAILIASAALIHYRPRDDIRVMARTLVRATEKRGEWDDTINSEHIKRARVALVLQDKFDVDPEWLSIIIEEAVFDMEVDRDRKDSNSISTTESDIGQHAGRDERDGNTTGEPDFGDSHALADREPSGGIIGTGGPQLTAEPEDLEIPSSE